MSEHQEWLHFRYRDFYDVPRCVVVAYKGVSYLLDCPFDDRADNYSSEYVVYWLPPATIAQVDGDDWTGLSSLGSHLGTVPVRNVVFDPTRRAMFHSEAFTDLVARADLR